MDITGQFLLPAPPESVWQQLVDPVVLARCIPGCETLTQVGPDTYECRIRASYGPVKASFATVLVLSNVTVPVSYTLTGRGQGGSAGFGEGSADVELVPADGGTELRYVARISIGGRIAQVGERLFNATTRKLAERFFSAFASGFATAP
jgi:uncharacterized protein